MAKTMTPPKIAPDLKTYSGRLRHAIRSRRESLKRTPLDVVTAMTVAGYKVSVPTLYHWENGTREPPLDALPYLAKALGLTVRELLPAK